jgi:hypothetical protein
VLVAAAVIFSFDRAILWGWIGVLVLFVPKWMAVIYCKEISVVFLSLMIFFIQSSAVNKLVFMCIS